MIFTLLYGRKSLEGVQWQSDGIRFTFFEDHSGCFLENWLYGSKVGISVALSQTRDNGSLDWSGSSKDGMKWLTSGYILRVECFRNPKTTFKFVNSLQGLTKLNSLIRMIRFITAKDTQQKQ